MEKALEEFKRMRHYLEQIHLASHKGIETNKLLETMNEIHILSHKGLGTLKLETEETKQIEKSEPEKHQNDLIKVFVKTLTGNTTQLYVPKQCSSKIFIKIVSLHMG